MGSELGWDLTLIFTYVSPYQGYIIILSNRLDKPLIKTCMNRRTYITKSTNIRSISTCMFLSNRVQYFMTEQNEERLAFLISRSRL